MVREETTKTASLILSLAVLLLLPFEGAGICRDASVLARLSYPFFHVGILHALLNIWCFLSIVFFFGVTPLQLFLAYIISVLYPVNALSPYIDTSIPTIGFSGVCYALIGIVTPRMRNKALNIAYIAFLVVAGYLFGSANAWLHTYSYLAGLLVGLLQYHNHGDKSNP